MNEKNLQNQINELKQELARFKADYALHNHTITDGTSILRKNITLDPDQGLSVGYTAMVSQLNNYDGNVDEYVGSQVVGPGLGVSLSNRTDGMQQTFLHYPNQTDSFLVGFRKPAIFAFQNTTISVTMGGNTVTISGFNFVTNELAGALINIYDSSGNLVETQTIASNTATVVTIVDTWLNSTANGIFFIARPYFVGSSEYIYQRFYTQEGTSGGIRFGVGPTNGGQNGLLYMDAAGALWWRDKAGVSTPVFLNAAVPLAGTHSYWVSDTNGGPVDRQLTFQDGILISET